MLTSLNTSSCNVMTPQPSFTFCYFFNIITIDEFLSFCSISKVRKHLQQKYPLIKPSWIWQWCMYLALSSLIQGMIMLYEIVLTNHTCRVLYFGDSRCYNIGKSGVRCISQDIGSYHELSWELPYSLLKIKFDVLW